MNEFIIGMLTSEVYEEKINAYIIDQSEKAFRISKAAELYKLYMNYICGYISPFTVHRQEELQPRQKELRKELAGFSVREYNQVVKRGCKISPSSRLSNNIYLGENTIVGDNARISRSIILKNCKILPNVILENCLVL
jgi:NDP-sugar pyrophosphorylase family protein